MRTIVARTVLSIVAAAAPLAAADSSDDVRLTVDRGVATTSHCYLRGNGEDDESRLHGEPWRATAAWMHRFAAEDRSGPLAGVSAFYQEGPARLDDPFGSTRLDVAQTTSFGFDLAAGYAVLLPRHPLIHFEATAFGGYFEQAVRMRGNASFGEESFAASGWDLGLAGGAFYTLASRCEIGVDLRWLLRSDSQGEITGARLKVEQSGLLVGLSLGYRL